MNNTVGDKIFDFLFGQYPYRTSQFLRANGSKYIKSIKICRKPIMRVIDKLFNILSLGQFNEVKSQLGYDDLFHLYMIVTFQDNTSCIVEKNQDINITSYYSFDNDNCINVDIGRKVLNLNYLLNNTMRVMKKNYYSYNSFYNNCQDYIYSIVNSNKLATPQINEFIKQNAPELLKSLPSYTSAIANATTKTASYINRFIQGLTFGRVGFKRGGLIVDDYSIDYEI